MSLSDVAFRLQGENQNLRAKVDRLARALASTNPWLRTYPDDPDGNEGQTFFLECIHCFARWLWVEVGAGIWTWQDERHNPGCEYLLSTEHVAALDDK